MTADDFEEYVRSLGHTVERITDKDGRGYTAIRGFKVPTGALAGRECDIAFQRPDGSPYTTPTGIHTRPALVPMDWNEPRRTKVSDIGSEWQYWSRRLDAAPTPKIVFTHILTVLTEAKL